MPSDNDEFKLINSDCLSLKLPKADMILSDPPYELSDSKGGGMMNDDRKFMREIQEMGIHKNFDVLAFLNSTIECFESLRHYNGVYFCSKDQLIHYINFSITNKLQYGIGVWHKSNPAPLCNFKYLNDVEFFIYIKGKKCKILGNYHTKSLVYSSPVNKKGKKSYGHPTIKPVELMEKFVTNHSVQADVILDPFMGTGSTGVACMNLKRKFIGFEIDRSHYNTALLRVKNEVSFL